MIIGRNELRVNLRFLCVLVLLFTLPLALAKAQTVEENEVGAATGRIDKISTHMGEMSMGTTGSDDAASTRDQLRFEPFDMIDDIFRKDIVLLMRHGPTDWSKLDMKDVAPTDCANQRILSPEGAQDMVNLGILLAGNGVRPGKIVVSEWCRNQQTLDNLRKGFAMIDSEYAKAIAVEKDSEVNLLLSLRGAENVNALRSRITGWTGDGFSGPLLVISHFTNIDELTDFHVYEGEILVIDPKRDNRVRGYMRLKSAAPDVGHFTTENADIPR